MPILEAGISGPLASLFSFKVKAITLPSGEQLFLKPLCTRQRLEWMDLVMAREGDTSNKISTVLPQGNYIIKESVCDEKGQLLFVHLDPSDLPTETYNFILDEALRLNGLGAKGEEEVKKN